MRNGALQSRRLRLASALIICVVLEWVGWNWLLMKGGSASPGVLDLILSPGAFLGFLISDGQGGPVSTAVMWIVTTALLVLVVYGLASLIIQLVRKREKERIPLRRVPD